MISQLHSWLVASYCMVIIICSDDSAITRYQEETELDVGLTSSLLKWGDRKLSSPLVSVHSTAKSSMVSYLQMFAAAVKYAPLNWNHLQIPPCIYTHSPMPREHMNHIQQPSKRESCLTSGWGFWIWSLHTCHCIFPSILPIFQALMLKNTAYVNNNKATQIIFWDLHLFEISLQKLPIPVLLHTDDSWYYKHRNTHSFQWEACVQCQHKNPMGDCTIGA